MVTSVPLLTELARVLVDKFGWEQDRTDEAVAELIGLADIVEPEGPVRVIAADPEDDRVLEAAAAGNASAIVSGDEHLLSLSAWRGIPILRPAEFLEGLAGAD